MLPNRYRFSRSTLIATEQMPIFQKHFFWLSNRYRFSRSIFFCYRTDNDFPGSLFRVSTNRYRFSRSTHIATEQIRIFQVAFFEYQRTDRQFQGIYPPPNRYFSNRFRWLLSKFEIIGQKGVDTSSCLCMVEL